MTENKRSIWYYLGAGGAETPADRANNKRLSLWSMVWAFAIIAATAVVAGTELPAALSWSIVLAPNLVALMTMRSYLTFLRMTDEMQRRVQIEGLAVGFGTGWGFTIGYVVAEAAGAPPLNLSVLVLIMTGGWLTGNWIAMRRYQ